MKKLSKAQRRALEYFRDGGTATVNFYGRISFRPHEGKANPRTATVFNLERNGLIEYRKSNEYAHHQYYGPITEAGMKALEESE